MHGGGSVAVGMHRIVRGAHNSLEPITSRNLSQEATENGFLGGDSPIGGGRTRQNRKLSRQEVGKNGRFWPTNLNFAQKAGSLRQCQNMVATGEFHVLCEFRGRNHTHKFKLSEPWDQSFLL